MGSISAQFNNEYRFKFKTYTTQDGLVHNFTKKCVADSNGFLWIITQHGLSRFDGLNFKNFENVDGDSASLPENNINDIAIDNNDRIWLSYNKGLCYYDQANHVFHRTGRSSKIFQNASIVYNKPDNCIYCVGYGGYAKINCDDFTISLQYFIQPLSQRYHEIGNCMIDSKQRLWICVPRKGYYTIDLLTNQQYYYDKAIWPMSVFEDANHQIWMTTWSNGFHSISTTAKEHIHTIYFSQLKGKNVPIAQIQCAVTQSKTLTGDSILWLANQGGVTLFGLQQRKFIQSFHYDPVVKYGLATDFNSNIYTDKKGVIWIATWHGITKINKQEQQFNSQEIQYLKSSFLYNRLSGIQDDDYHQNIAWLSAEGSGLFKINKATGKVIKKYYYKLGIVKSPDDDINYLWRWTQCLFKDSDGNIWSPVYGGLIKITSRGPEKIPLKDEHDFLSATNIIEYGNESLWIATFNGLVCYDTHKNRYHIYKATPAPNEAAENAFYDLKKINDDEIAVAGKTGVFLFNIKTKNFTALHWRIAGMDSTAQHYCNCLECVNNDLFIGTRAGLICHDLQTGASNAIGRKEGIGFLVLCALKKDADNNVWIYSSGGLFKYNLTDQKLQKFTTGDGIYDLSNDGIGFFEYNHLFYIGYRMAFTSFDPLQVNVNPVKSAPIITDFQVNNQSINKPLKSFTRAYLQLPYDKNNIVVNYTSPDFTNTDKVTFAYELQGYDTNWVQAGRRRAATYTNLVNGAYIFKVKACNSSGLWNDEAAVISFQIATPFWKTWWFYMLVVILSGFLIYKLYRYRINRMLAVYSIRDTISKNLHDEIGATLISINIYSEVAKSKLENDNEVKLLLQRIHDGSANMMENMSDIVWYVNPKNDNAENIIIKMREYAAPVLEAKQANLLFTVDDDLKKIKLNMQQRQNFYLLFKEAINNIAKYAAAKHVVVSIKIKDNKICLTIEDDGKGFSINDHKHGNGLINMQQRATLLHGKCTIKSAEHTGTSVTIIFPVSL